MSIMELISQDWHCLVMVLLWSTAESVNPFASGIQKVLLSHITGLFSVKIRKNF